MIAHALGIAAATTVLVLVALLPFLPGSYDGLAVPLSMMAQISAWAGLPLLVPIGALWLIFASRGRAAARPRAFVFAAAVASSLVWSHDLERRRGFYAVRDTPHPHWKYFLFD